MRAGRSGAASTRVNGGSDVGGPVARYTGGRARQLCIYLGGGEAFFNEGRGLYSLRCADIAYCGVG